MSLKDIFAVPTIYQAFQEASGFYGARLAAINKYIKPKSGQRIIDIGCGPGYMARDLPDGVEYFGFDVDERYIAFANRKFGDRGRFFCRLFDDAAAGEFKPADIVMMNAVLHHISDAEAAVALSSIYKVLRPGGALFTFDGAYLDGQPWLARFILDNDRGRYVRTPKQYTALLERAFPAVEPHVHDDLARIPCAIFIGLSRKGIAEPGPHAEIGAAQGN